MKDVVGLIKKSKKILVLTGAGVSTSCGIPDFRSKNGIYSRLQEFQLSDPQEMFDIHYFKDFPQTFYAFAKEIYPSNFQPSKSHEFIKLLEDQGRLLRNYSQNIDTLETKCGIENVVNCHGSFKKCACLDCKTEFDIKFIEQSIFQQQVPYCKCGGIIKPNITFFGEGLPLEFHRLIKQDLHDADLLIVIGTSLKVQPVCNVLELLDWKVPQILINRERLRGREGFDVELLGDCDGICNLLQNGLQGDDVINGAQGDLPWSWKFQGCEETVDDSSSESSESSLDSCEDDEPVLNDELTINIINEDMHYSEQHDFENE